MVYLEYHKETKQVIEIHNIQPTLSSDYDFALSEKFVVGNEFELTIWINEVDENKNLISYSAIRNNPNAKRLLEENKQFKETNMLLTSELAKVKIDLMLLKGGGS